MRNILIATDFSPAARNAAIYGLELAKVFNAGIILVNAYQQIPLPTVADVVAPSGELRSTMQEQLDNEAFFLSIGTNITVEAICAEGPATSVIIDIASKKKADIILLGMKISGKGMRKFFGSTVTSLTGKIKAPLLVIPEDVPYRDPLKIALADDLSPDADIRLLDTLRLIVQRFRSKFYIVRVMDIHAKSMEVSNMPAHLKKMIATLDPVFEYPVDTDIIHGLKGFIATREVNMLVMIPHKHSLLERWFVKSHTKSMTFESFVPLLILPDIKHKMAIVPFSEHLNQHKGL